MSCSDLYTTLGEQEASYQDSVTSEKSFIRSRGRKYTFCVCFSPLRDELLVRGGSFCIVVRLPWGARRSLNRSASN